MSDKKILIKAFNNIDTVQGVCENCEEDIRWSLFDLKNKCDQYDYSQSTCKVAPTQDQSALLGTLLGDAKNTQFGSIVAR